MLKFLIFIFFIATAYGKGLSELYIIEFRKPQTTQTKNNLAYLKKALWIKNSVILSLEEIKKKPWYKKTFKWTLQKERKILEKKLNDLNRLSTIDQVKTYLVFINEEPPLEDERPVIIKPKSLTAQISKIEEKIYREANEFELSDPSKDMNSEFYQKKFKAYDFRTDRDQWLDDAVIIKYLKILSENDKEIAFIEPTISFMTLNNHESLGGHLSQGVKEILADKEIKYVFFPVNPSEIHWYLMVFDIDQKSLKIFNSFGKNSNDLAMGKIIKENINHFFPENPKVIQIQEIINKGIQKDSKSCGLYTLAFAEVYKTIPNSQVAINAVQNWVEGDRRPYPSYILQKLMFDLLKGF